MVDIKLGTGERKDLFITTADNQPLENGVDILSTVIECPLEDWRQLK